MAAVPLGRFHTLFIPFFVPASTRIFHRSKFLHSLKHFPTRVRHEQEQVMQPDSCVTAQLMGAKDSRNPLAGADSKSPLAAMVKSHGGERKGKVPARPGQMSDRKLNGSEPPMTCRKKRDEVKTATDVLLREERWRSLITASAASGMKVAGSCRRRLCGTLEPSEPMLTEKLKRKPRKSLSRDAARRGGTPRISKEVPDKGMERRGRGHEGWSIKPTGNGRSL